MLGGTCLVCNYYHQHYELTACADLQDAAIQVGNRDCSKPEGRVPVSLNDAQSTVAGLLNSSISSERGDVRTGLKASERIWVIFTDRQGTLPVHNASLSVET